MTFDPTEYDAVVYDLDGTLVDLTVDWAAVRGDVMDVYVDNAIIPPADGLWDLLGSAGEYGIADAVEETIAAHEREGARGSIRLPLADRLDGGGSTDERGPSRADGGGPTDERGDSPGPVAVCSLNCEDACRIALETHRIDASVDAVVGRDTIGTYKPDPDPLLAALDALGADPARAAFVGDSERDALTAERAGVPFVWVADAVDG